MPKVFNKSDAGIPDTAVYIGRPSKWGNPFVIGVDGSRGEVISKYAQYLRSSPSLLSDLHELKGRDLVCFCKPKACHGDILLSLSNQTSIFDKL